MGAARALCAWATLIAAVVLTVSQNPEEDDVLVLTEKNFDDTIKAHDFILVEFYAPWCGHCKQFAPEFSAAARQLKRADPPVPLAKVDATYETRLAEDYGIRGYPTIRMFVKGRDQEYTGGRTEQNIVTWVLKKIGPPAILIEDVPSAEQFEKDHRLGVIAFLSDEGAVHLFEEAARNIEDVAFAYTSDPSVMSHFRAVPPQIRMHFPHDDGVAHFKGDRLSPDEIELFVKKHKHPLITPFNGEIAPELFGDGRPILFLFRDHDDKGEAAEAELSKAAPQLDRRILISTAGSSEPMDQRLMDYVSVDPEEMPAVRLVSDPTGSMSKYRLEGEVTSAAVVAMVQDFEAGRLRPHLKSEAVPASQPGPVYTLVGSTFQSIVKDRTKDVLVEFYAPWCGHCKKLEPVYREVARRMESIPSLIVAKIDGTANDVEGIDVEGFPTIKLWRASSKDDPLEYDSDRDVDSFVSWLEEKASLPFSREDIKAEL